ncbi:MAG: LacI family DNA-binding transcriptional regulator, partial [Actinomycetota bacterium]
MGVKTRGGRFVRRATLREVAAEVGVSLATVSNAYNRPDQLSPALRERVFEAARRLGYPGPDPKGRGLRRGRAGAVGVVYADRLSYAFADPAAVKFLEGVSRATG